MLLGDFLDLDLHSLKKVELGPRPWFKSLYLTNTSQIAFQNCIQTPVRFEALIRVVKERISSQRCGTESGEDLTKSSSSGYCSRSASSSKHTGLSQGKIYYWGQCCGLGFIWIRICLAVPDQFIIYGSGSSN